MFLHGFLCNLQLFSQAINSTNRPAGLTDSAGIYVIDRAAGQASQNIPVLCQSNKCLQCMINVTQHQQHRSMHMLNKWGQTYSSDHLISAGMQSLSEGVRQSSIFSVTSGPLRLLRLALKINLWFMNEWMYACYFRPNYQHLHKAYGINLILDG